MNPIRVPIEKKESVLPSSAYRLIWKAVCIAGISRREIEGDGDLLYFLIGEGVKIDVSVQSAPEPKESKHRACCCAATPAGIVDASENYRMSIRTTLARIG